MIDDAKQYSTSPWAKRHLGNSFIFSHFRIDWHLFFGLALLSSLGLVVLYSAGGQDTALMIRQCIRLALGFFLMFVLAQISPHQLERWTPPLFGLALLLLIAVLAIGVSGKGAQRWLDLGLLRFQPSELMKLVLPMMIAWYLAAHPLPPSKRVLGLSALIIAVPTFLIIKQPDLGTSLLIASSGIFALLLAGIPWRLVFGFGILAGAAAPLVWFFGMHAYQRQRVLTFLNPESDPLGSGYHIIQSKIAIGSGGIFGKGWLNGTQSQLEFLPERSTDFIFAVFAEEFGLVGIIILLLLYLYIIGRSLVIAAQAQNTFNRILAGSITLTFFVYIFVNIGMVSGILPVVGLPLPLMSYGGTSMVTMMLGFGILMSIQTHRKLLSG